MTWSPSHLWNFLSVEDLSHCPPTPPPSLFLLVPGVHRKTTPSPTHVALLSLKTSAKYTALPMSPCPAPTFLLAAAHFHKLRSFPMVVFHRQTHPSFAHFSFRSVICRAGSSFSVLHVTDGQRAVRFVRFWWTPCPHSWLRLLSVWPRQACTPTHMCCSTIRTR